MYVTNLINLGGGDTSTVSTKMGKRDGGGGRKGGGGRGIGEQCRIQRGA